MIIFFLMLLITAIVGLRKADSKEHDYMSLKMTNSIKGFFLCLVFFSHIWGYTDFSHPYLDGLYQKLIRERTGQCIVTMFLFYSGYGVMESVKKKGQAYIDAFPMQRILKVLLSFDCVIILFWIYRYMTGVHYGLQKMLLTFIGWDGIGNSNWYIFCILWLYIFTFVAFKVFKGNYKKATFGILMMSLLYMAVMCRLGKEYWWYDTTLCYVVGMFFSLYRKKIETIINNSFADWIFFVLIFALGHIVTYDYRNTNPIIYQLWIFCFVAAIVSFTMRYVVDSAFLRRGGVLLFALYILQRLPMMILKPYMLSAESSAMDKYEYVIVCFGVTIVISVIYNKTIQLGINKIITKLEQT